MTSLNLTATKNIIQKDETTTIQATLLDTYGRPIPNATIFLYQEVDEDNHYSDVLANYKAIKKSFQQLRTYLIYQLNKCYVTGIDDYNFTELIEAVGDIKAKEYYNSNNVRPENKPAIDNTNLTTYNKTLYFRIRYYMRLLAYYLVLKGIPATKVAQQKDLKGLISLIGLINAKKPSTLSVQNITQEYYYGTAIALDYTLVDINGDNIQEGEITIESNGVVYDSIEVGDQLRFVPINISPKNNGVYIPIIFTFKYRGTDNYDESLTVSKSIIIKPAKAVINIVATNINEESKYYLNNSTGYETDDWRFDISVSNFEGILEDAPISIVIDGDTIDDVTDEEGNYTFIQKITTIGNQTITVSTTYENTDDITNETVDYQVIIKYNPLYQETNTYEDYLGKSQYQYILKIKNENTGTLYDDTLLSNKNITMSLDGQILGTTTISNGIARYNIPLAQITTGEHILYWNIDGNQAKTFITIYSNFIIPSQKKYYVDNTPDIIYAPLNTKTYGTNQWIPVANKNVNAVLEYTKILNVDIDEQTGEEIVESTTTTENITLTTNNQGILTGVKNYTDIGKYKITLTSASDNISETTVPYEYEEAEPYVINITQYSKREPFVLEATVTVYDETFLDITSTLTNNNLTLSGVKRQSDNQNELIFYYGNNSIQEGSYTLNFIKNNQIINNNFTFSFIANPLVLLTQSTSIGTHTIELLCNDASIEEINLESDYITANTITKEGNKFIIDATFIKAGNVGFTIHTEDEEIPFTITVNKGTLNPSILIEKITPNGQTQTIYNPDTEQEETIITNSIEEVTQCYYDEVDKINISLIFDEPLIENINVIYSFDNQDIETYTFTTEENDKTFLIPNNTISGVYNLSFTYTAGNNNSYNSFQVTDTFTILKSIPTHEITDQYTAFKNLQFFIYQPEFTENNPETLTADDNTLLATNQSDGIWESCGYYLANGWANTGTWECDFDIKGDMMYIGFWICAIQSSIKHLFGGWEGNLASNPPGTYTRSNDDKIAFINKTGNLWGLGNARYFDWCHVNIKKTSPTTITITKTGGEYYNGSVTYEWQELSNYPIITIGSQGNEDGDRRVIGKLKIKNLIVRGVY